MSNKNIDLTESEKNSIQAYYETYPSSSNIKIEFFSKNTPNWDARFIHPDEKIEWIQETKAVHENSENEREKGIRNQHKNGPFDLSHDIRAKADEIDDIKQKAQGEKDPGKKQALWKNYREKQYELQNQTPAMHNADTRKIQIELIKKAIKKKIKNCEKRQQAMQNHIDDVVSSKTLLISYFYNHDTYAATFFAVRNPIAQDIFLRLEIFENDHLKELTNFCNNFELLKKHYHKVVIVHSKHYECKKLIPIKTIWSNHSNEKVGHQRVESS